MVCSMDMSDNVTLGASDEEPKCGINISADWKNGIFLPSPAFDNKEGLPSEFVISAYDVLLLKKQTN